MVSFSLFPRNAAPPVSGRRIFISKGASAAQAGEPVSRRATARARQRNEKGRARDFLSTGLLLRKGRTARRAAQQCQILKCARTSRGNNSSTVSNRRQTPCSAA